MKKILLTSSILAIFAGIILIIGGIWGVYFTYKNVTNEKIITPSDASLPEKPVKGIFTLKSQADIIRKHTLEMTDGKTFAQMPRQIPKVDESGNPILDDQGKNIMVINTARDIWVTATTLTTALNFAIFAYVFSVLIILFGGVSIWTGFVFYFLSKSKDNF